jgi:PKD repeat protein
MRYPLIITALLAGIVLFPLVAFAQEEDEELEPTPTPLPSPEAVITVSGSRNTFTERIITFDVAESIIADEITIEEVLWNFGDGVRTTGERVSHAYNRPGVYTVRVTITTDEGVAEDSVEISVFEDVMLLLTDSSASDEQLDRIRQEAARANMLLMVLRSRGGPEAVVEEDLTNQLIDARDALDRSRLLVVWTSGSVGSNVLSKFAQHMRHPDRTFVVAMDNKGIIILSETPFGVLAPTAQSAFDQLRPAYVLLTRPQAIDLLLEPLTPSGAREAIFTSPIPYRLLGPFSARAVHETNPLNIMSIAINFLVNRGVPINNITLVLMLPVIATILSFSRQVIGIKAFGLITPTMTTLSFLVVGLRYGLIVFSVILLAGTLTRLVLRKLHLLYLPRMALVLTSVSLAILVLFGLGVALNDTAILSFSIFPILILTLLAEEFIAVQFKSGARQAFIITAWTMALSIACYFIVSWELLRTLIISYPEIDMHPIPINILIGRWSGLSLTE